MNLISRRPSFIRPLAVFSGLILASRFVACDSLAEDTGTKQVESTPAGPGKISGRVVFDKDGSVAPGATVLLLFPPAKGENFYIGPLPLQKTVTDAEGRFTFESLPIGNYRVWANLDKLTSRKKQRRGVDVKITEADVTASSIDLRLIEGVSVVVTVKDQSTGELIPDATVHPIWSDFKDDFRSAGKASVTVQPLTREQWRLEVWGDGFAKQTRSLNLENGTDQELEFQLIPGADLKGVVRDPDGNPIAGIGLGVRMEHENEQLAWTQTDKQGQYRLDHIPLNQDLTIYVSKLEWVDQSFTVRLTNSEQTRDLTMVPRPHGGTIIGTIVDKKGQPIPNAELTNIGRSSNEVRKAKSDENGRYKLDNLYRGLTGTEVVIRANKFAPQRLSVEPGTKDHPAELDIEMDAGHRIVGKVVDEMGRGIDGVTIHFANGQNFFYTIGGKGATDKEGRFNFDSLPADCPFSFQKKDYSALNDVKLELDSDQEVLVEMIPVGVILGKVTDRATGKPVRKFNVRMTFSSIRQPNDPSASLPSEWIKPGRAFQSETGDFQVSDLIAGMPLQVMIDAEGYESAIHKRVEAACRDTATEVAFELEPVDPKTLRHYRGQLLDAQQSPVSAVQMRLIVARNRNLAQRNAYPFNWDMIQNGQITDTADILRFLSTVTDKDGRFEFRNVPRDLDTELVWWSTKTVQGRLDHVEAFDEKETIEIILPKPACIKGKIDLKAYEKIGYVQVSSREGRIGGRSIELKQDQDEFEVGNLPAGQYDVTLMTPYESIPGRNDGSLTNRRLFSQNIVLEEGDFLEIEFNGN